MKTIDFPNRLVSSNSELKLDHLVARRSSRNRLGISTRAIVIALLATVGVCIFLGAYVWIGGAVSGREFSPQSFATRRFMYWRLPFINTRISPTYHTNSGFACDTDILKHLPTKLSTTRTFQWHLVDAQIAGSLVSRGEAGILTELLSQDHWETWSANHKPIAKIVWPVVQQLAARECYWAIPELLLKAKSLDDAGAVQKYLDQQLPIIAQQHAADLIAVEEWELAEIALDWVETMNPEAEVLQKRDLVKSNSVLDFELEQDRSENAPNDLKLKNAITDDDILGEDEDDANDESNSETSQSNSDNSTAAEIESNSSFEDGN